MAVAVARHLVSEAMSKMVSSVMGSAGRVCRRVRARPRVCGRRRLARRQFCRCGRRGLLRRGVYFAAMAWLMRVEMGVKSGVAGLWPDLELMLDGARACSGCDCEWRDRDTGSRSAASGDGCVRYVCCLRKIRLAREPTRKVTAAPMRTYQVKAMCGMVMGPRCDGERFLARSPEVEDEAEDHADDGAVWVA